jgi:hypothetical protein
MVPLAITVRVKAEAMPEDPDPDTRHDRAQIRTAVSDDLTHWNDEGLAEEKGPAGSWDMIILRRPFGSSVDHEVNISWSRLIRDGVELPRPFPGGSQEAAAQDLWH